MLSGKSILIISPNQLECVGLKSLLNEMFSPEQVLVADAVHSDLRDHPADYIFTTPELYVVHHSQLPAKRRIVILTRNVSEEEKHGGPAVVNVTQPQSQIVDQLEEIFRRDEKAGGEGEREDLTAREVDVLKLVARGFINKQIADKLSISLHTVISHRKNITRKLGIRTVSGLTMYAMLNGLITTKDIR